MSEFLVDRSSNKIKSTHQFPMKFSISGKYPVNVPGTINVNADSDNVNDLLNAKLNAIKAQHPLLTTALNDELILTPNVDTAQSSRFITGPGKRTAVYPGGSIVTNTFVVGAPTSTVFIHVHGFLLYSRPPTTTRPGPSDLLHGFDVLSTSFEPFNSTIFSVAVRNSTNTSTVAALTLDAEQPLILPAATYRLRFTNTTTNQTWFLSDWTFLHN